MKDRSEDINESTMGKTNNAQAGKNSHNFDRMTVILRKQLLPTEVKKQTKTDNLRTGRDLQILNPEFPKSSFKKAQF